MPGDDANPTCGVVIALETTPEKSKKWKVFWITGSIILVIAVLVGVVAFLGWVFHEMNLIFYS